MVTFHDVIYPIILADKLFNQHFFTIQCITTKCGYTQTESDEIFVHDNRLVAISYNNDVTMTCLTSK